MGCVCCGADDVQYSCGVMAKMLLRVNHPFSTMLGIYHIHAFGPTPNTLLSTLLDMKTAVL